MLDIPKLYNQIKALLVIRSEFNKLKEVIKMKPGWKTTEFWLVVANVVANIWLAVSGVISPELAAKIIGTAVMVYTVARAIAKWTPSTKDDEFLDKLVEIFKKK